MMTVEEIVRQNLRYDPETGLIWWKVRGGGRPVNRPAGTLNKDGYVRINVAGRPRLAHRVAWLLLTGKWPELFVDHANGDRSDNRACNLREANRAQNYANAGLKKSNTSGFKGVSRSRNGKWRATIKVNRKHTYLGEYDDPRTAANAYQAAAAAQYGEFYRDISP